MLKRECRWRCVNTPCEHISWIRCDCIGARGRNIGNAWSYVWCSRTTLSSLNSLYPAMALKSPAAIGGHSIGYSHHRPDLGDLLANYVYFLGNLANLGIDVSCAFKYAIILFFTDLEDQSPGWRNGRRTGLKIPRWQHCVGSSPTPGTSLRSLWELRPCPTEAVGVDGWHASHF